MPTPSGVPVAITSPGASVTLREMTSISVGMSKIKSAVLLSWRSSPFTRQVTRRLAPSTSSAVTIHGPIGPKPSMALPKNHCLCACCRSRAVTSFITV